MPLRFNPPPTWPAPPTPDWVSPAGWRPDAIWPELPRGWQLLVPHNEGAVTRSLWAALAQTAVLVGGVALLSSISSFWLGGVLVRVLVLPWLATWLLARIGSRAWPWWRYSATAFAVALCVGFLDAASHLSAAGSLAA